jgi:hypothetical protein
MEILLLSQPRTHTKDARTRIGFPFHMTVSREFGHLDETVRSAQSPKNLDETEYLSRTGMLSPRSPALTTDVRKHATPFLAA